jgi:hypothetical protein
MENFYRRGYQAMIVSKQNDFTYHTLATLDTFIKHLSITEQILALNLLSANSYLRLGTIPKYEDSRARNLSLKHCTSCGPGHLVPAAPEACQILRWATTYPGDHEHNTHERAVHQLAL